MSKSVLYVAGGQASGFVAEAIKAHADQTGARVVGKLDLPRRKAAPIEPAQLAALTGDLDAVNPADAERARALIKMRLASPKRAEAGKPIEQQQDAAHLPLFVAANEPKFL